MIVAQLNFNHRGKLATEYEYTTLWKYFSELEVVIRYEYELPMDLNKILVQYELHKMSVILSFFWCLNK
jgi:hypothetical protein